MKKKKGFTLVELLVVIAILAVLATVSVVGYMGFTKKAHESNDIGLTTQMNTILQAEEVTNKPSTPHEAVQQLANGGVDVEKLTPTTDGYNYVYDLDTNRMFLLDNQKAVVAPTNIAYTADLNVFAFVGSESEIANWNGYSVYLKSGFIGTTLNITTGLDVGDKTGITTITYKGGDTAKEVLIRTNGGALNIDAPLDTIHHYNYIKDLDVTAVSNNHCYYEHGFVGHINKFDEGKFVTTSTTEFFQTEEEINDIFKNNANASFDDKGNAKFEQNIYDDNGLSVVDGKPGPSHVHSLDDGKIIIDSTCGQEGKMEFSCTICHETIEKIIPATGLHTWGTNNVCVDCGAVKDDETGEVSLSVDTFLGLKNIIEHVNETSEKEVKFFLSANLATNATSIIKQTKNTKVTLDLNGHTLALYNSKFDESNNCYTAGFIVEGELIICDSSNNQTGKIIASKNLDNNGDGGLITVERFGNVSSAGTSNNQFILKNGIIDSTNNENGIAIMMWHNGSVTIDGGLVKAKSYAISGSSNDTDSGGKKSSLIINGGKIISENSFAIYHPQYIEQKSNGCFIINDGELFGKNGVIYLGGNRKGASSDTAGNTGGTLEINGGKFESNGDSIIYVNSTYLKKGNSKCVISVSISDGTFIGKENTLFAKVVMNECLKKTTGGYYIGSDAFSLYLKGGNFNLNKNNFIYAFNYTNNVDTSEKTIAATAKSGYSIKNNTDGTWYIEKN